MCAIFVFCLLWDSIISASFIGTVSSYITTCNNCSISFLKKVFSFIAKVWTKVKDLTVDSVGKRVLVRARLHTTRGTGNHT